MALKSSTSKGISDVHHLMIANFLYQLTATGRSLRCFESLGNSDQFDRFYIDPPVVGLAQHDLNVYPNPITNNSITMTFNVQTADDTKESRKVEFNLDQVINGSYFLRAKTTNSILIEGVIINK